MPANKYDLKEGIVNKWQTIMKRGRDCTVLPINMTIMKMGRHCTVIGNKYEYREGIVMWWQTNEKGKAFLIGGKLI